MSHSRFARILAALILGTAILILAAARTAPAWARPVALADAKSAPTFLRYVPAGGSVTHRARPCGRLGGYFTDVSAYRWNGRSLGPQRRYLRGYAWDAPSGRSVRYDGVTFHNGLRVPVLVAGWCP